MTGIYHGPVTVLWNVCNVRELITIYHKKPISQLGKWLQYKKYVTNLSQHHDNATHLLGEHHQLPTYRDKCMKRLLFFCRQTSVSVCRTCSQQKLKEAANTTCLYLSCTLWYLLLLSASVIQECSIYCTLI